MPTCHCQAWLPSKAIITLPARQVAPFAPVAMETKVAVMAGRKAEHEPESAPGKTPASESALPLSGEPEGGPAPGKAFSVQEELKIQKAMAFYQQALEQGPRLAREVLAEGKRQGHAKRTQERARSRLNVQKIPPTTWQGPWLIALPGHPAVKEAKQRKERKQRKAHQRQGNGRKRRKRRDGGGSSSYDELLAAAR